MARIPTINAQNITPPPGTAGGVLLGRVGTSNIQVRTPLTQQMNPANFGQQGAMVAQLGNTLLNDVFLPMQEKEQANARAKQSMEAQMDVLTEINDVKGKLEKKEMVFGEDYHHGAGLETAWEKHWKGIDTQIDLIIPNMQSRVDNKTGAALSSNYIPQVMALKLKAQTTRGKVSESRTVVAYQDGSRALAAEMADIVPRNLNTDGEPVYMFQGAKWDSLIAKKQLLDNIFENSKIDPAVKASTRESTRKDFIDELTGAFEANPKMGMEFLNQDMGEKFGLTPGEVGGMFKELNDIDIAHMRDNNFRQEQIESEEEAEARKELEPKYIGHLGMALKGLFTSKGWAKDHKVEYEDAGMQDDYKFIQGIVIGGEVKPGDTDPEELAKVEFEQIQHLNNPGESDLAASAQNIATNKKISETDRNKRIVDLANLNNNKELLKSSNYTQAKNMLTRQAPVPLDPLDTRAAALRSKALWRLFGNDVNRLLKEPEKFQNFDWNKRVNQLLDDYSGNNGNPSDPGSQIFFRDFVRASNLADFPGVVVQEGNKIYPDVVEMRAQLQANLSTLSKDQIRQANDSINSLATYSGLSQKVKDVKRAIEQANQPEKPKELTGVEKVLRNITPDEWEEMGKKQFPELYKSLFGKTPEPAPEKKPEAATPAPTPAPPKPAPVKADPRQAEMFSDNPAVTVPGPRDVPPVPQSEILAEMFSDNPAVNVPGPRDVPPVPQFDFSRQLAGAEKALRTLQADAEAKGYDTGLINLLDLAMLALQNDAMGNDPESFKKSFQSFMKQVGDIQGKQ